MLSEVAEFAWGFGFEPREGELEMGVAGKKPSTSFNTHNIRVVLGTPQCYAASMAINEIS